MTRLFSFLPIAFSAILMNLDAGTIDFEARMSGRSNQVARVPGRFDYAWDFGHDPRLMTIGREESFSPRGWSLDLWFRLDDPAGTSTLISSNRWQNFRLAILQGKTLSLIYHRSGGHQSLSIPFSFTPGIWYQLVLTQEAGGKLTFYLNGEVLDIQNAPMPDRSAHIGTIGSFHINGQGMFDHVFKGVIDRPRLHDAVLSREAVRVDYLTGCRTLPLIPLPRQVAIDPANPLPRPKAFRMAIKTDLVNPDHRGMKLLKRALADNGLAVLQKNGCLLRFLPVDSPELPVTLRRFLPEGKLPPDGYLLDFSQDVITVTADSAQGFFYGILTLRELLKSPKIPHGIIFDYPEFPLRAALMVIDTQPPLPNADWLKQQIAEMADQRIRYLMLRTHDWAMINRPEVRKALCEIIAYARTCEMIVIPYLQTYSHAKGFLFANPRLGHTETVRNESVTLKNGNARLARHNVNISSKTPVEVRTDGNLLLEEGRDYQLDVTPMNVFWNFPPEVRNSFSWARPYVDDAGGVCSIRFLPGGRLKQGSKLKVTYDVYAHGECTCPFLPEYQNHLAMCIDEALKLTGSDYINLGLDEIWNIRGSGRCCADHPMSAEETLAYAFNSSCALVKKNHPEVKILAFSDMLDSNQTPAWKNTDVTSDVARLFTKDIQMMPWYYADSRSTAEAAAASTRYFLERGFPVVGVAGKLPLNQLIWGELLYPLSLRYPVDGFLYTMWDDRSTHLPRGIGYDAYTQMIWSPDRFYAPNLSALDRLLKELHAPVSALLRAQLSKLYEPARQEYRMLNDTLPLAQLPQLPGMRWAQSLKKAEKLLRE